MMCLINTIYVYLWSGGIKRTRNKYIKEVLINSLGYYAKNLDHFYEMNKHQCYKLSLKNTFFSLKTIF